MSTNKLALVNSAGAALARATMPPGMVIQSLADAVQIGRILAASRYFKDAITEQQAIAKILRGWELGIPPVAALENINVIDGKTTLSAHLIAAKINDSGRFRQRIVQHTVQLCVIRFDERVDGAWEELGVSEFTLEDARLANLLHKKNWQQYPKAMLYARAVAQGARWYCSTTFMGQIYVPEELGGGEVTDVDYAVVPTRTNSEQISDLLDELEITDIAERKVIALQHLGGHRAADLSQDELADVLSAIRQAFGGDDTAEAVAVNVEGVPAATMPDLAELSSQEQISALLDDLDMVDFAKRQQLVKQALGRRSIEALTPDQLQEVLNGIRQAAQAPA